MEGALFYPKAAVISGPVYLAPSFLPKISSAAGSVTKNSNGWDTCHQLLTSTST